jgi:hypothetical protein
MISVVGVNLELFAISSTHMLRLRKVIKKRGFNKTKNKEILNPAFVGIEAKYDAWNSTPKSFTSAHSE